MTGPQIAECRKASGEELLPHLSPEANALTNFFSFVFLLFSWCVWSQCLASGWPWMSFLITFLPSPVLSLKTELARPALRGFLSLRPEYRDYKRSTTAAWFLCGCWILTVLIILAWQDFIHSSHFVSHPAFYGPIDPFTVTEPS